MYCFRLANKKCCILVFLNFKSMLKPLASPRAVLQSFHPLPALRTTYTLMGRGCYCVQEGACHRAIQPWEATSFYNINVCMRDHWLISTANLWKKLAIQAPQRGDHRQIWSGNTSLICYLYNSYLTEKSSVEVFYLICLQRVIIPLNFSILFKGRNAKRSIYLQTLQHIKEVLSRS